MDQFSYLSVLLSIVVGLAITQILQGYRGIVLARARVEVYWPVIVWSALLLAINVQSWWAMFGLRVIADWTFAAFAIVLAQTIIQYLLAAIVLPDFGGADKIDLRDHYWRHTHLFFGLFVLVLLVSLAKDLVLVGQLTGRVNLAFHLGFITLTVIAMLTRREWYHRFLAVASAATFCAYIVVLFTRLR
jgi:hypothetical protein